MKTIVYKLSESRKTFAGRVTSKFVNTTQHDLVPLFEFSVGEIRNILWCVGSVGYVELLWETTTDHETICVLSGSGKFDVHSIFMEFEAPENSTGRILLRTDGFDDLDSFTILIGGTLK